jgi:hypothetical protein
LPEVALPPPLASTSPRTTTSPRSSPNAILPPPLPEATLPPLLVSSSSQSTESQAVPLGTPLPPPMTTPTPAQETTSHKKTKSTTRGESKSKKVLLVLFVELCSQHIHSSLIDVSHFCLSCFSSLQTSSKEELPSKDKEEKTEEEDVDFRVATELHEKGKVPYVNITYKNCLYVYPLSIKFPTKKVKSFTLFYPLLF